MSPQARALFRRHFAHRKTYRAIRHTRLAARTEAERIAAGFLPQPPTPKQTDMNAPLPDANYKPGWPAVVTDVGGLNYALVRDGVPTGEYAGHSCLYAVLDRDRNIMRYTFHIPQLGAKPEELHMVSGGPWMTDEEFAAQGLPPMTIPSEPVEVA